MLKILKGTIQMSFVDNYNVFVLKTFDHNNKKSLPVKEA